MKTKPQWILSLVFLLSAQILGAPQQEHTVTLKRQDTTLVLAGNLPKKVSKGDVVVVGIENAGHDTVGWRFKFSGNYMQRLQVATLQFKATVETEASQYDLIFEPGPNSAVKLTPSPLAIAGSVGSVKPAKRTGNYEPRKKPYNRRKNEINLYFDQDGLPYQNSFPTDVDDNDIINIYIIAVAKEIQKYSVAVAGKFASAENISIQYAEELGTLKKFKDGLQGTATEKLADLLQDSLSVVVRYFGAFGPYAAPSITITIKKDDKDLRNYPIRINNNYIGSFRFGVAKSRFRFNRYELKRFAGSDSARILNVSNADGEFRYFLTVVFYGWRCWKDKFWNGRDLDESPTCTECLNSLEGISERLNPLVGIGLKDFGNEYVVGFSFEVARGLDIFGGRYFAKVKELAGNYKEGDVFKADAADIPIKEKWKQRRFFGVSVDLVIATKVLGSLFGS